MSAATSSAGWRRLPSTHMRAVFPALHDRLLSTLLFGAVLLFLIAMVAVSMRQTTDVSQDSVDGPPLFVSGATPA